jgi:hypothetical protein
MPSAGLVNLKTFIIRHPDESRAVKLDSGFRRNDDGEDHRVDPRIKSGDGDDVF